MTFLTLHELSLHFDVSVRVLRSRLRKLLLNGELLEGRDCRRDSFVDETHFIWRVDPGALTRATGLQPVSQLDSQALSFSKRPVNQRPFATSDTVKPGGETLINVDSAPQALEREMINLLKEQVRIKDVQIADLNEQNKALNGLHLKLTGQIVQQADRIQTLLQLTGGKMDLIDVVNPSANRGGPRSLHSDNPGTNVGNHSNFSAPDQSNTLAA